MLQALPIIGQGLDTIASLVGANANRKNALKQWERENEYNRPINQRRRLEEAGLNPALMYGHGSVSNTASSMKPPELDLHTNMGAGMRDYVNLGKVQPQIDMIAEQIENLRKQRDVMDADIAAKAAGTAATLQGTAKTKFDLDLASELRDTSVDAAKEGLRAMRLKNAYQEIENSTLPEKNKLILQEIASRLDTASRQRDNMALDAELKRSELTLRSMGLTWNDPIAARIAAQFIGKDNLNEVKNDVKKHVKQKTVEGGNLLRRAITRSPY